MIFIGEISKKKIHDHILEDSIIKDLWWSKNLPSLFKIWFERIEINQMNFGLWERSLMFLQRTFWSYKVKRTSSFIILRITNISIFFLPCYLLMIFCEKCFIERRLSRMLSNSQLNNHHSRIKARLDFMFNGSFIIQIKQFILE